MEWKEIVLLVLGSSLLGSASAAGITAYFNVRNSKKHREHEKEKLYFEKALEAFQSHTSPYMVNVTHFFNQAAQIENILFALTIKPIESSVEMQGLGEKVLEVLKKNQEIPSGKLSAGIKIFINTDSCKPNNWDTLPEEFHQYTKELATSLYGKTHEQKVKKALENYLFACKEIAGMYSKYVNNLQTAFAKQMNNKISLVSLDQKNSASLNGQPWPCRFFCRSNT